MRYSMLILIVLLILLMPLSAQEEFPGETPPAGYNESCASQPFLYEHFGPYCLHPVYWDIPGYYPIGYAIAFINPETALPDIGRVTSYHWDMNTDEYVYQALVFPSPDPLLRRYLLIAPSALIALP